MTTTRKELFTTVDTRCWQAGSAALVLSLERDRPTITSDVLEALERAVLAAERGFATLVVTATSEHFGFGAHLNVEFAAAALGDVTPLEAALERYQRVMLRLRHATVPTIAAVRGVAVSGACELLMHVTRVVAHSNSYIGLAEASVGVIPGGGGLKEFALRAARAEDPAALLEQGFVTVCAATIARSALQAQQLGYLTPLDHIDAQEPLAEAIELGCALHAAGHVPPPRDPEFRGTGDELLTKLRAGQAQLLAEGALTRHQLEINVRIAEVLCGTAPAGSLRTEAELLALEREHFLVLIQTPPSQARLAHYRSTGTLLKN
jgi:3-hydroxyacyl-CoA dehydrogenase